MKKPNDSNLRERRTHKRLELKLPIRLNSHEGESGNISNSGVYLEIATDNVEKFSRGKLMEFEVTATASKIGFLNKILGLSTKGVIVRADKIAGSDNQQPCVCHSARIVRADKIAGSNNRTKLGIALAFNEKLEIKSG